MHWFGAGLFSQRVESGCRVCDLARMLPSLLPATGFPVLRRYPIRGQMALLNALPKGIAYGKQSGPPRQSRATERARPTDSRPP